MRKTSSIRNPYQRIAYPTNLLDAWFTACLCYTGIACGAYTVFGWRGAAVVGAIFLLEVVFAVVREPKPSVKEQIEKQEASLS